MPKTQAASDSGKFIQKIISVSNSGTHRTLTVGIKIRMRRKHPLEKIEFQETWHREMIENVHDKYNFKGKTVYEIGADVQLKCAQAAVMLGAKSVHAANPYIELDESPQKITIIKDLGENSELESEKFDLVYGLALLEHVINPEGLAKEICRLLKKGGNAYLHGWPLWSSQDGHHIYVDTKNNEYRFFSPIFDNWYHLTYPSLEEFREYMLGKNVPDEDVPILYRHFFELPHISRLSATEIIDVFKGIPEFEVSVGRRYTGDKPNKYYEMAKTRYSEDDLKTRGLWLFIRKK